MFKRLLVLIAVNILILNVSGFAAVVGGVSEFQKVRETINASYSQTIDIVKTVLKEQNIKFEKANIDDTKAKIKGIYSNNSTVNIVVDKFTDTQTKIEVRVGTSQAGMEDAKKIIGNIVQHCNSSN